MIPPKLKPVDLLRVIAPSQSLKISEEIQKRATERLGE